MRVCENCGNKNYSEEIVCSECGNILIATPKKVKQIFLNGTSMEVDSEKFRKENFYRCRKCGRKIYMGQISHRCKK